MASANNLPRLQDAPPRVAVQETAFSIDAVGRYLCSTWDEATASGGPPFDAIVIGAGMYGAYCAQHLYRLGKRVLVLEAGPFLVSEHIQNLARLGLGVPPPVSPASAEAQRTRELVWGIPWRGNQAFPGLAYCVGGKSLYWGGWSPRLTTDALLGWPQAARAYLAANYPTLERQIGVAEDTDFIRSAPLTTALRAAIDGAVGISPLATLEQSQTAPIAVQGAAPAAGSGLFSFDKYSSAPLLADAIREDAGRAGLDDAARRLFLVPRVHVVRLIAEGGRVAHLEAATNDRTRTLDIPPTCAVVLALSAIESTRLALESFPTPLMGRNLMVHLRSNTTVRIRRTAFPGLPATPLQTAALHVPGIAPHGARFHLQLTAAADPQGNPEAVWFRMIPNIEELERVLAGQDADWIAMNIRGCGEMRGQPGRGAPDPGASWLDLSPFERDEHGARRAYVHLVTTAAGDATWDAMDAAAIGLAQALAGGPNNIQYRYTRGGQVAWYDAPPPPGRLVDGYPATIGDGGVRDPLGTTYHEAGTLWMGDDPATSVTTPTGRFHYIANAYCADQALFPTVGSANPALTGLVLARRVAEAIAAQV